MAAIHFEVGGQPNEAVGARRRARPQVWSPQDERRGSLYIVESAGARIGDLPADLIDLGFDQPLYGEAAFIGVRLAVQIDRRISAIDRARQEYDSQVRIACSKRPRHRSEIPKQGVGIGA